MEKYIHVAREAVAQYGIGTPPDLQHLLAVLIGPKATPEVCGRLSTHGVRKLAEMTPQEFREQGFSPIQSQRLFAAFEVARRWVACQRSELHAIHSPEDGAKYMMNEMRWLTQEHFVCLYLNTKNEVLHKETVFIGSLNASIVHPREAFKGAIRHSAASIICFHNHPAGDPVPSREDISITKRLVECGNMIGIEVLDHIVIGDEKFVSLKEKGYV